MRYTKSILFLGFILFNACSANDSESLNSDVFPAVVCMPPAQSFKLKFSDKNTGTDLLFDNLLRPTKYKLTDVNIYSSRFKKNLEFSVDSINKTNRFIVFSTAVTDEFFIRLAQNSADKLSAETQFIDQPCCDELKLTKLTLNSTALSFVQFSPTTIILKK